VTRYDPVSRTTRTIALSSSDPAAQPDSIAFGNLGGPAVWVGDSLSKNVYRVDASSREIRTYTVGGAPTAIAVGANAVWIVSEHADAVYALDPASGALRTTIDVGSRGCNAPRSVA